MDPLDTEIIRRFLSEVGDRHGSPPGCSSLAVLPFSCSALVVLC